MPTYRLVRQLIDVEGIISVCRMYFQTLLIIHSFIEEQWKADWIVCCPFSWIPTFMHILQLILSLFACNNCIISFFSFYCWFNWFGWRLVLEILTNILRKNGKEKINSKRQWTPAFFFACPKIKIAWVRFINHIKKSKAWMNRNISEKKLFFDCNWQRYCTKKNSEIY